MGLNDPAMLTVFLIGLLRVYSRLAVLTADYSGVLLESILVTKSSKQDATPTLSKS
jgi:hypothetical protein